MKKLFTLLLVILTQTLFAQEFKPDKWCERLLTDEVIRFSNQNFPPPPYIQPVIYFRSTPLSPRFVATAEILEPGVYIISVNWIYLESNLEMERTIIHELQHILQFHSGRLKTLDTCFYWEGMLYGFDWPYDARPWEIEADQVAADHCD